MSITIHRLKNKTSIYWTIGLCVLLATSLCLSAEAASTSTEFQHARVDTLGAGLISKVAPGEFLPVLIKLLNFGGGNKIDVTLTYTIKAKNGREIYSGEETVAVETTASFVKTIQVPFATVPGQYTTETSIRYKDQLVPATTQFNFIVERKVLGLFESDFFLYGGITVLIALSTLFFGRIFVKRYRTNRLAPLDYKEIPRNQRVFYELISDTIMEMRERVGDRALSIAGEISGLEIDGETGRVLDITKDPAKIIALLVSGYEHSLGKKVSFLFRREI